MPGPDESLSLVAGASFSNKPVNQDAFACVHNCHANLSAIVVADGLGSHAGAENGSSIAVTTLADLLNAIRPGDEINMCGLFRQAWQNIVNYAREKSPPTPDGPGPNDAFGTTLLCAVETPDRIILAYVGNGAIFHIRANFNTFPPHQLLPWTALNYLNPHSIPQKGKAAISRLLSLKAQPHQIVPTVLTLSKDEQTCGDIILCCSDGIYSYDQTAIGYDDHHKIWVCADPPLPAFFAALSGFFNGTLSSVALTNCLEEYLQDLDRKRLVEDDCTAAVLITQKALTYQNERRASALEDALA